MKCFQALIALIVLPAVQAAGWVYAGTGKTSADVSDQMETWGGLCVSGNEQSPINVVTSQVVETGISEILRL